MIRLYRAVCSLIEAHAETLRQSPEEPYRETDIGSSAEATGQYQRDELHADSTHREEDWSEDPDQARRRQIGFTL